MENLPYSYGEMATKHPFWVGRAAEEHHLQTLAENLAFGRDFGLLGVLGLSMGKISVAFVDDHPVLLEGLVANFAARTNYAVVGTGACAGDALVVAAASGRTSW